MMRCLVVDDEPLAVDLLEDFISKVPFLTMAGSCRNAFDCIESLNNKQIDVLFLDIQMPNLTGIQLLKGLNKKPMVIFTTAYSEYAVESYNHNAIDYLLKPFTFERFLKAVNKAYSIFKEKTADAKEEKKPTVAEKNETQDYIFVKADYKTIRINIKDILYIEGLKDYVKIYSGDKPILSLLNLKSLEEKLPGDIFQRVHRSYIVSIPKIESIQKHRIIIGEKYIPIGDSYKENFYKKIDKFNI